MREPRMLSRELYPLAVSQMQRLELAHLPFKLFALRSKRGGIGLECDPVFLSLLPSPVPLSHLGGALREPAVGVEQLPLCRRPQQRLMLMLSVNVHEEFAELAQLRERYGPTIDEAP